MAKTGEGWRRLAKVGEDWRKIQGAYESISVEKEKFTGQEGVRRVYL